MLVASESATGIGLVPLAWLGVLRLRGKVCDPAWWWLAGAFFVSWLADTATHIASPWLVGATYPLAQMAVIAFVFLNRTDALQFILAVAIVGVADFFWHGVEGPNILLRTVSWLSVAGIMFPLWQLGRLRTALLVYFTGGWALWMAYAYAPGWTSWGLYQITRLAGILLFCWAASNPLPQLKLSSADVRLRSRSLAR
jgi:hypothetical protein